MGNKWITVFLTIAIGVFLCQSAQAQNEPKRLVYLGEYKVKPDKIDQFESVMKDFVEEMVRYEMPYTFRMFSTDLFVYYSVNEFESYGELDQFNAYWGNVEEKIGAATMDRYHKAEFGAIYSFKGTLLKYRPEQSYIQEHSPWAKNEDGSIHWVLCFINPSKRQEWAETQKKWVELYKKENIKMSFLTFTGDIGYEMPVWIYLSRGENRIEHITELDETETILGNEGRILLEQSLPLIIRAEERSTIFRPDLSYVPVKRNDMSSH